MDNSRLPRFRKGDPFPSAQVLNDLVDRVRRQRLMAGQGTGVLINETPNGTTVRVAVQGGRRLAQTSTTITARSGTTAGTGTVAFASITASTAAIAVGSQTQSVFNFSANSLASGKYCWVEQDPDGNWWVVSIEC